MNDTIKVEYQGVVISYVENQDVWRCWDLSVEGPTLTSVKAKVNKVLAEDRKVAAIEISSYWIRKPEKVTVTAFVSGRTDKVWVRRAKTSSYGRTREQVDVKNLILDNPQNQAVLDLLIPINTQIDDLTERRKVLFNSIPRISIDTLKEENSE